MLMAADDLLQPAVAKGTLPVGIGQQEKEYQEEIFQKDTLRLRSAQYDTIPNCSNKISGLRAAIRALHRRSHRPQSAKGAGQLN